MAAVLAMRTNGEPDSYKWVDRRLDSWALLNRGAPPGAGSTAIGYLRERLDHAHDSAVPTKEQEITERAVARVKVKAPDYYELIELAYLRQLGIVEIAAKWHMTRGFVSDLLETAWRMVGVEIEKLEKS